jgi:hypothetical protein
LLIVPLLPVSTVIGSDAGHAAPAAVTTTIVAPAAAPGQAPASMTGASAPR